MSDLSLSPASNLKDKCGRVAVLMGGASAEREISLKSGRFVLQALLDAKVDAFAVDVKKDFVSELTAVKADRVFNVLHGRGGEDGQVQAVMDVLGIPYVGSGIKASAVTMDKLMTKRLLQGCGINTPAFLQMNNVKDCDDVIEKLGLPLIIKPLNEGSSIGMSKVEKAQELAGAYEAAACYGEVMAEQWMHGNEYTVAWLGGKILPPILLQTPHQFYDYEAKYQANDTSYICPCGLSDEKIIELEQIVAETVAVCDLRHWGRVDVMMDAQGVLQVIEVNTVPGMTDHSLVPMAAREVGLDFQQLVLKLVELSMEQEVAHA